MPKPPPQAKPGLGAKLTAVALGASGGMPGIEKAIDYYHGVKDKPIADWKEANAREEASNKDVLATRTGEANIANVESEIRNRDKPPAKPVTNDFELWARQNPDAPARDWLKLQEDAKPSKELSQEDRDSRAWIDAHPADFQPDASGNKYIASNMVKARLAYKAAERPPERGSHTLVAVPQPDGSSKVIEAAAGTTIPKGAETISEMGHKNAPTADEQRRADLANNLTENLDRLEEIVKRRPDLFGPLAGRATSARQWTGTSDPDVAALATLKEQTGMAMVGAHAMRNAQHVEAAANSIVNAYKNQPEALLGPNGSIAAARNSLKTFIDDVQNKSGTQQPSSGAKPKGQWNPQAGRYE